MDSIQNSKSDSTYNPSISPSTSSSGSSISSLNQNKNLEISLNSQLDLKNEKNIIKSEFQTNPYDFILKSYGLTSISSNKDDSINQSINQNISSLLLNFFNTILPSQFSNNSLPNFSFLQFPALLNGNFTALKNEKSPQNIPPAEEIDKKMKNALTIQQSEFEPINLSNKEESNKLEAPLDLSKKDRMIDQQDNVNSSLENHINHIENNSDIQSKKCSLNPPRDSKKEMQVDDLEKVTVDQLRNKKNIKDFKVLIDENDNERRLFLIKIFVFII
jgi:hypothetical protein